MKTAILINARAGALHGLTLPDLVRDKLARQGITGDVTKARTGRAMAAFIRLAKTGGYKRVIVAGGDGTIGTIMKGLINARGITMGLIPTGSLNNICGKLGIPSDIDQAIEAIVLGKTRGFDAASVGKQYMIEGLGLGLIAEIFDKTDWDKEKKVVQMVTTTIKQVFKPTTISVTAQLGTRTWQFETVWLTLTNLGNLGAMTLSADSRQGDGKMEFLYCKPLTLLELPKYAASFARGTHLDKDKFEHMQVTKLKLSFPRQTTVHIDDQTYNRQRLDIAVLHNALTVYTT